MVELKYPCKLWDNRERLAKLNFQKYVLLNLFITEQCKLCYAAYALYVAAHSQQRLLWRY